MGAALGIHPLAVLIVTIAGGALFGAVGLILAAPLVSAVTRISADLAGPVPRRHRLPPRHRGRRGQPRGSVTTSAAGRSGGAVATQARELLAHLADVPRHALHRLLERARPLRTARLLGHGSRTHS